MDAVLRTQTTEREAGLALDLACQIDALWERYGREEHVPGMVAGVVREGRLIHFWSYGVSDIERGIRPDENTVFRIASMTKSFTALAVMLLRDDGLLRLDDPAADHLPELNNTQPFTSDSPSISVRDLLSHTAGFVNDDPWADRQLGTQRDAFTQFVAAGLPQSMPTRSRFEYANLGYALLGRVVANVSGERFQDFVDRRLFRPLSMTSTTFDPASLPREARATPYRWTGEDWVEEVLEPDGEFGAIGGIATTAADYARYLAFLLDAWPARDSPENGPIRRSTVRELAVGYGFPWGGGAVGSIYGYGMVCAQDAGLGRHLNHAGGLPGYGSLMHVLPDEGLALFTFANRTYAQPFEVNQRVARVLKESGCGKPAEIQGSAALLKAADAIAEMVRGSSLQRLAELADPCLLQDRPIEEREAGLRRMLEQAGSLREHRIKFVHALSATISFRCESGTVRASLLLAPTEAHGIQKLEFEFVAAPAKKLFERLREGRPSVWLRPAHETGVDRTPLTASELEEAGARFERFRPALTRLFPSEQWNGRIESPLTEYAAIGPARTFVKRDDLLPMTGSVKARGGVYEVLCHVEELLAAKGIEADRVSALEPSQFREALGGESIYVASTGNLGFSIGLVTRVFGMDAKVFMSRDAKQWKKDRLRAVGADVVECDGDYSKAVDQARRAAVEAGSYFVDDERSRRLFVGYAVAADELARQLEESGISVDGERPLIIYLPCGVGGAPGGITAGLKRRYGNNVICVFVEPTASACMMAALASGRSAVSVYDLGIDNHTVADGLAVAEASQLVLDSIGSQIDAAVAVGDDAMISWVGRAWEEGELKLEPSGASGFAAMAAFADAASGLGRPLYLSEATHIVWATGGSMLPQAEFQALLDQATKLRTC